MTKIVKIPNMNVYVLESERDTESSAKDIIQHMYKNFHIECKGSELMSILHQPYEKIIYLYRSVGIIVDIYFTDESDYALALLKQSNET